jgi:hypothetical protein
MPLPKTNKSDRFQRKKKAGIAMHRATAHRHGDLPFVLGKLAFSRFNFEMPMLNALTSIIDLKL